MSEIFNILPGEGLEISGKIKILLGQKVADVDELLKENRAAHFDNSYFYYDSNLCIGTGNDNTVSEIELIKFTPIPVMLYGINPFGYVDEEIIALLSEKLGEEPVTEGSIEESTTVSWEKNGISLWRPSTPKKVLESAEEARVDGFYDRWMKEEYEPSRYFQTILIKQPV